MDNFNKVVVARNVRAGVSELVEIECPDSNLSPTERARGEKLKLTSSSI